MSDREDGWLEDATGRGGLRPDWADAWIWAAIGSAASYHQDKPTVSVADVIGAADGINHAIPTIEELQRAVNRLASAGYIAVDGMSFVAAEITRKAYDEAWEQSKGQGLTAVVYAIERQLPPRSGEGSWSITEDELHQCYTEYMASMGYSPRREPRRPD
jgi:hypothetical protein